MWDGLADLIGTLADMANDEADPRFFLSSLGRSDDLTT